MLLAHPSLPVRNINELIALAKARPGQLNFGSAGNGSSSHLTGELFKMHAGISLVHVAYQGTPFAVTDLIGGRISMMFANNSGGCAPKTGNCEMGQGDQFVWRSSRVADVTLRATAGWVSLTISTQLEPRPI
jgi:hypothetical protein